MQDIMRARTASQFEVVIQDAAPIDLDVKPQLVRSAQPPSSQVLLIIRPGESGGLLTYCNRILICRILRRPKIEKENFRWPTWNAQGAGFIVEDLRVDFILEIENMISDSCRGEITEYDVMDSNGLFASSEILVEKSVQMLCCVLDIEIFSTCTLSTKNITVSAYSDQPIEAYGGKSFYCVARQQSFS